MANNKPFIEQANQTVDWVHVLKQTVNKSNEKLNVATLAFVEEEREEYDKYDILTVSPFPLEQGQRQYTLRCYVKHGEEYKAGDIVVVLFTNRNFKNNLEFDTPQETSNEEYHPLTCGVIVYALYKQEEEEGD